MSAPLVIVGDALLDVDVDGEVTRLCPDAPVPVLDAGSERERPGGAALAALLTALASSRPVRLVTPLGDDADSRRVRELLDGLVEVVALPAGGSLPVKSRLLAGDRPLLRLDRGGLELGPCDAAALAGLRAALDDAGAVLVADYGRGVTADEGVRDLVAAAARRVPVVWDPHPKGATPVAGVTLATPNLDEARAASGVEPHDDWLATASRAGAALRAAWRADAVAVTAGSRGAVLHGAGGLVVVPARAASGGDPCGAGDRFAGATALALALGPHRRRGGLRRRGRRGHVRRRRGSGRGPPRRRRPLARAGPARRRPAGPEPRSERRCPISRIDGPRAPLASRPVRPAIRPKVPFGRIDGPRVPLAGTTGHTTATRRSPSSRPPGPAGAAWSPPAAASTSCTPGTPAPWAPPGSSRAPTASSSSA